MFQTLNQKYFELFSALFDCRAVLPPKQYETMANALKRAYNKDLEVILGQKELETAQSTFELRYRLRHYVPRRCLFGWNRVARAMKRECLREFRAYLDELSHREDPPDNDVPPEEPVSGLPVPTKTELPV